EHEGGRQLRRHPQELGQRVGRHRRLRGQPLMTSDSGAAVPPSSIEGGTAPVRDDAGPINAVPVRHPGRWVALVVIAVFFAMIVSSFVTNDRWDWPFAFQVMNYSP